MPKDRLMISQHWFKYWLGAVRQQAITWANVDSDLCRHMASLGHNVLKYMWKSGCRPANFWSGTPFNIKMPSNQYPIIHMITSWQGNIFGITGFYMGLPPMWFGVFCDINPDKLLHEQSSWVATGEFPAQRASNTENVSVWWRHHVSQIPCSCYLKYFSLMHHSEPIVSMYSNTLQ